MGAGSAVISFIGAGNYATAVLIPAFKAAGARLNTVASSGGVSGVHAGRKFGFAATTTDTDRLFADAETPRPWSSPPATTAMPDWSCRRWRRASTSSSKSRCV